MAVPKRKISKARKRKRRTHDALVPTGYVECPQCKKATLPHTVCGFCGTYRGRQVISVEGE